MKIGETQRKIGLDVVTAILAGLIAGFERVNEVFGNFKRKV